MKNNDLVGKLVLSNAGRDKNHLYVIIRQINEEYVFLSNGGTKTMIAPKKKKLKHLIILEDVDNDIIEAIISNNKGADLKIKRFIKLKGIVKEG